MTRTETHPRIYLSPPHQTGDEADRIAEVLAANWLAPAGPQLAQFERQFAKFVDQPHTVALSSGTAALHLALRHLKLQPGDEVICPTLTFCASANPIVYEGAQPVFLDCDERTWNLDPNLLEQELAHGARWGKLPRAIITVDLFGQPADMAVIAQIAGRYGVPVIEDAAEALGSTYRGEHVGQHAWASFYSFNGNKIITTSGGGMLCSGDAALIDHVRHLATQAREPAPHYQHEEIGYNYRLSNLLAAVGLAQLAVLPQRVQRRREIYSFYQQQLADMPGLTMMPQAEYGRGNCWLSVVQIDADTFGATSEDVRQQLEAENIESRPVWKPLHRQPSFAGCRYRGGDVADRLFEQGLCLPSGTALSEFDLHRVVKCVKSAASPRPVRSVSAAA